MSVPMHHGPTFGAVAGSRIGGLLSPMDVVCRAFEETSVGVLAPQFVQFAVLSLAILVAATSIVAGVRARVRPAAAAATAVAATTFAVLAPINCGILHSFPPIGTCGSVAGAVWRYQPDGSSYWLDKAALVAQVNGWGVAALAAAMCFALLRVGALALERQ